MKSATKKNSKLGATNMKDSMNTKVSETSDVYVGRATGSEKKLTGITEKKHLNKNSTCVTEIENTAKVTKKCNKKGNPYTVFVGNIPYNATKEEIKKHFEKAGEIVDIRIPTQKGTEKRKGFAYVEVKDRITYEKALALHHTHMHGRQINVEYTTQGKKGGPKEEKIKQKNLKLRALSKIGILFPRKGLKGKHNDKVSSTHELVDSEKKNRLVF